ncbi:hypothetical protein EST52_25845, partial [Escherichia coli]|nr:hypothetical protein [Escherichia coli]
MKNKLSNLLILPCCLVMALSSCAPSKTLQTGNTNAERFSIVENPASQRIDILLDGKRYTSYLYADSLKKPILFPLMTRSGNNITRGWPIEPRANERTDHPHQMGLWLKEGEGKGGEGGKKEKEREGEERRKEGESGKQKVESSKGSNDAASRQVSKLWLSPRSEPLLSEQCIYKF